MQTVRITKAAAAAAAIPTHRDNPYIKSPRSYISAPRIQFPCLLCNSGTKLLNIGEENRLVVACLPSPASSPSPSSSTSKTRLFVSGLSFRTTEESLRNAFKNFGNLIELNLVMDKIANRPRGFAFICYATEEESQKAIEGMHGKFLDGRVIFVEIAKPRSELRQGQRRN